MPEDFDRMGQKTTAVYLVLNGEDRKAAGMRSIGRAGAFIPLGATRSAPGIHHRSHNAGDIGQLE